MTDLKLIQLIKILSKKDVKNLIERFKFSKNLKYFEVFEYLISFYPSMDNPGIEKEIIVETFFSTGKEKKYGMRNAFSGITKVIEDYIVEQELKKDELRKKLILMNFYKKKNSPKLFQTTLRKAEEDLENERYTGAEFQQKAFEVTEFRLYNPDPKKPNTNRGDLDLALYHLKESYQLREAIIKARLFGLTKIFKQAPRIGNHQKNINLELYELILKIYSEEQETDLKVFSEKLIENSAELKEDIRFELGQMASLFFTTKFLAGNKNYIKFGFDFYKEAKDHGILLSDNQISSTHFINIIKCACMYGEVKWAEEFAEDYKKHLKKAEFAEAVLFSKYMIHFYKKEYWEAYMILNSNTFDQPRLRDLSRFELIKCSYLLYDSGILIYPIFFNHIKAYQRTMKRMKHFSENRKSNLLNFGLVLLQIAKSKKNAKFKLISKEKILEKIERKPMPGKTWLIQLLEEEK